MVRKSSPPEVIWLYVARRVWWRLLTMAYLNRLKIIAVIVAVLALGLLSLWRGVLQGQASIVGVMPVTVTALRLEPRGERLALVLQEKDGARHDHVIVVAGDDTSAAARIVVALSGGETRIIRAPPADPVALSLTTNAPIHVEGSAFDRAAGTI
jgi:hypothetical protein